MLFFRYLLLVLIIVLSFFPRQINAVTPMLIVFFSLFLLLFLSFRVDLLLKIKKTVDRRIILFFVLFLVSTGLSVVFSIDRTRSLGVWLLYFSFFIIYLAMPILFSNFREKEKLAVVFVFLGILLSIISFYHTMILQYVNRESYGAGFFWVYYGHNHLSDVLLFSLPFAVYFLIAYWSKKILRPVFLIAVAFLAFSFLITFSRGSIISLILATLLVLFFLPFNLKQKLLGGFVLFLSLLFILVYFGSFQPTKLFMVKKYPFLRLDIEPRVFYWRVAIDNFRQYPLVGSGLDTYRFANLKSKFPKGMPKSYYAHNFFLQMLSDAGILGFLSSVGLILAVLWQSFRTWRKSFVVNRPFSLLVMFWLGLLASIFNNLVDPTWSLPAVFLFFWIIAGVIW